MHQNTLTFDRHEPDECSLPAVEDWLLSPVSLEEFLDQYHERKVLHVTNRPHDSFLSLFSRRDAEALLWQHEGRIQDIVEMFAADSSPLSTDTLSDPPYGQQNLNWVHELYRRGVTIRLNQIGQYWLPIARVEQQLTDVFPGPLPVMTNAYITPPNSQGLAEHFDTHDVFIVQVEGSKKWRLFDPVIELPLHEQGGGLSDDTPRNSRRDITLHAGDVLYIPRGVLHAAQTGEDASVHLTIALHALRWIDLLKMAAETAAKSDVALRRSVKATRSSTEARELRQEIEALLRRHGAENPTIEELVSQSRRSLFTKIRRLPDLDLANPTGAQIGPDDVVMRRPNLTCLVECGDGRARIHYPGLSRPSGPYKHLPSNFVEGPAFIEPALRFVAEARGPFCVRALPGGMSDKSKVVLVKRLIGENILRQCMEDGSP